MNQLIERLKAGWSAFKNWEPPAEDPVDRALTRAQTWLTYDELDHLQLYVKKSGALPRTNAEFFATIKKVEDPAVQVFLMQTALTLSPALLDDPFTHRWLHANQMHIQTYKFH